MKTNNAMLPTKILAEMDDNNLSTLPTNSNYGNHVVIAGSLKQSLPLLSRVLTKRIISATIYYKNTVTRILTFLRLSRTNNRQIAVKSRINLVL